MSTRHKIKIKIVDIKDNIYYKDNPQYFLKLKELIENNPKSYGGMLKSNGRKKYIKSHPNYISPYKHLKDWIDTLLKDTKVSNHKYSEKCYWIFHNMKDFHQKQLG